MRLDGSLAALVTGGASGLGEATAQMLAESGVKVAILDRDVDRGEAVAAEVHGLFVETDVTQDASVAAAIAEAARRFGPARILVNCAGVAPSRRTVARDRESGRLVPHETALFRTVLDVNLVGTFRTTALAAAAMAALPPITTDGSRGVVVNTASIAGQEGQVGQAAYAASKAGVMGMTLPLARDLAPHGIRVMTIMPGLFTTPLLQAVPDEIRKALEASVPFPRRLGQPRDFARLVRAIIENEMLNGECIRLDGALRMPPK